MKRKQVLAAFLCIASLANIMGYAYATEHTQVEAAEISETSEEEAGTIEESEETDEAENTEESEDTEEEQATPTPTEEASESGSTKTTAPTSVAVKKANQAVDSAKQEKETMEKGLDVAKKMLESLQSMKSSVESHVEKLDTELSGVNLELSELEEKLKDKIQEVENTQQDIVKAKEVEEKQYEDMKVRIKYMYEQGNTQYVELFIESQSIADFLNKADYITSISQYDRDMLTRYEETRKAVEDLEKKLLKEQEELEEQEKSTQDKIDAIELLVSAKEAQLDTVTGQIASKEQLIKEYEDDIAEQDRVIKELEEIARKAEEAENASESGEGTGRQTYDGGMFAWPCPGYTRISSEFGNRMHPTLGVVKFHNGIDMAAPEGTNILAAYDGTVISADFNSSMGNYVMIAHGDSLYTIYMHASALYVSTGDKVSKGDVIAAVGTTGRSTGNHLHFGVRRNGEYVDPREYIGY